MMTEPMYSSLILIICNPDNGQNKGQGSLILALKMSDRRVILGYS